MSKEEQQGGDFDTLDPMIEEQQEALAESQQAETNESNESGQEVQEATAEDIKQVASEAPAAEYADVEDTEPADETPAGDDATASGDGGQPETTTPEFDAALLADFNLTPEQAKAQFGTPEALANAGRLLDQRVLHSFQQATQQPRNTQPLPPQPRGEVVIPQEQQQTNQPAEADEFKMPEPSDGEAWDEDVTRLVQSLNEHHAKQLKAVNDQLSQQRQFAEEVLRERQAQENARYVQEVDEFANGLGDEWTAVLGKGSGYELGAQSPFVTARAQLDAIAQQLANGRQLQQLPPLTHKQLLEKALPLAFPNIQQQAVRQEVEDEIGKRDRMKTNRPTGRRNKERRTPGAAAADHAERWYAERGMAPLPFDDFDETEI